MNIRLIRSELTQQYCGDVHESDHLEIKDATEVKKIKGFPVAIRIKEHAGYETVFFRVISSEEFQECQKTERKAEMEKLENEIGQLEEVSALLTQKYYLLALYNKAEQTNDETLETYIKEQLKRIEIDEKELRPTITYK